MNEYKVFFSVIFILFLCAILSFLVVIYSVDLNNFRPQIEEFLSERIGVETRVGRIQLGFRFPVRIGIQVRDVVVENFSAVGGGDRYYIKRIDAIWEILKFLHDRNIVFSFITLDSAQIRFAKKNKQPIISNALNSEEAAKEKKNSKDSRAEKKKDVSFAGKVPFNLFVKKLDIKNGIVVLKNPISDPKPDIKLSNVVFAAEDVAFDEPFDFQFTGALLNEVKNISSNGQLLIEPDQMTVEISKSKVNLDLSKISIESLREILPGIEKLKLKEKLEGHLNFTVDVKIGKSGIISNDVLGRIEEVQLRSEILPYTIDQLVGDVSFEKDKIAIERLNFGVGKAAGSGQCIIKDFYKIPELSAIFSIEDLNVGPIVQKYFSDIEYYGQLFAKTEFKFSGPLESFNVNRLLGTVDIEIKGGRIDNVNILKSVLDKITFIPHLSDILLGYLSPEFASYFKGQQTKIKTTQLVFRMNKNLVDIDQIFVDADQFVLTAKGLMKNFETLTLSGDFYINAALSKQIIAKVPEFEALAGYDGRVKIPLKSYRGSIRDIKLLPDLEFISRRIFFKKGSAELHKLLNETAQKYLGIFSGDEPVDEKPVDEKSNDQEPSSPEEEAPVNTGTTPVDLLNEVLGEILQ